MTVKFYGNQGVGPVKEASNVQGPHSPKKKGKPPVADQVNFSEVLQKVSAAKEATPGAGADRIAKVQDLKERVANGTYQPDLQKVAASLLKFLREDS